MYFLLEIICRNRLALLLSDSQSSGHPLPAVPRGRTCSLSGPALQGLRAEEHVLRRLGFLCFWNQNFGCHTSDVLAFQMCARQKPELFKSNHSLFIFRILLNPKRWSHTESLSVLESLGIPRLAGQVPDRLAYNAVPGSALRRDPKEP